MINIPNQLSPVLFLSISCSLIVLLLNKNRYIKTIKFVCGVLIVASVVVVISPLYDAMGELITQDFSPIDESNNGSDEYNDQLIEQTVRQINKNIKIILRQRYEINESDVSISVTVDQSDKQNILIKSVDITIKKEIGLLLSNEIAEYIASILSTECIVLVQNQ